MFTRAFRHHLSHITKENAILNNQLFLSVKSLMKVSNLNIPPIQSYEFHNRTLPKETCFDQNVLDSTVSFVPISVIKQYLLKVDVIFTDGHACISIKCPFCKGELSMHINKVTGFFICCNCQKSGNWNLLELYFSSPKKYLAELPVDQTMIYGRSCWESFSKTLKPVDVTIFNLPHLKHWKKLTSKSLSEINTRIDPINEVIYIPLKNGDSIVGFKKIFPDLMEETFPDKSAKGVILHSLNKETAVIVANVKDFFTLLTYPLNCDVVCLPNEQQSLPQEILPLFEKYDKLILWFDNDVISWGNIKMFAKKLSDNRCCFVRPLENQPAPYQSMLYGYDIKSIIENAQQISHSSIVTFANLREDVLAEICNLDKVSGVHWERFPFLNSTLKGHRRGELTIFTGPTGSGKTTLMSEYSLDLAINKVTTLWGSFEIRNQRLAKMMLTQMFMSPLEKNINKFNEWADKFERLPMYFMTFYGQQPLDVVMEAVEHATYVHDVAHVIIDNVQFMLGLSSGDSGFLDRFYRQDALIARFRNFATTRNCHVTLVIHPRKEREAEELTPNSIFGGAKAAQEADNILIIQHRTNHSSMKVKKCLQVAKNRFSGDLGIMPLEFNKEALSFWNKKF